MQQAVRTSAHRAIPATLFAKGIPYLEKAIQLREQLRITRWRSSTSRKAKHRGRRSERRARWQVQDNRTDSQASPDEALGYGVRSVRSAAVKGGNGMLSHRHCKPTLSGFGCGSKRAGMAPFIAERTCASQRSAAAIVAHMRSQSAGTLGACYGNAQHLEPLDAAFKLVARFNRADTRRRTAKNEVARLELVECRQLRDDVRHIPQHLPHIRLLPQFAVHAEPDASLRHVAKGGRADCGDRCGTVKALSRILRLTPLPRGAMQITACQIDTSRVAEHMLERTPLGNVTDLAADRNHQLDLQLAVESERRIRAPRAVRSLRM